MKPEGRRLEAIGRSDVEISALVKSRELRFEEVPETRTRSWGSPGRASISDTERENLPEEVQSGVTYRNSTVRLRIAGVLVEADPKLKKRSEGG